MPLRINLELQNIFSENMGREEKKLARETPSMNLREILCLAICET